MLLTSRLLYKCDNPSTDSKASHVSRKTLKLTNLNDKTLKMFILITLSLISTFMSNVTGHISYLREGCTPVEYVDQLFEKAKAAVRERNVRGPSVFSRSKDFIISLSADRK